MSTKEMQELCEDILDTLIFRIRVTACSYGIDITSAFSRSRPNTKKHKALAAKYCMYHDLTDMLEQHGYTDEKTYTWETVAPVVNEMETLATALSLSKTLDP